MRRPAAARQHPGALRGGVVEYAQIARELAFRCEGPHVYSLEAVADADLPRVMHEPFDELTVDALVDVEALGGRANLTAIEERSEGGAARRDIDGCRRHDDEGVIPGGFNQRPLVETPASLRDQASCLDSAREGHHVGIGMLNQALADGAG